LAPGKLELLAVRPEAEAERVAVLGDQRIEKRLRGLGLHRPHALDDGVVFSLALLFVLLLFRLFFLLALFLRFLLFLLAFGLGALTLQALQARDVVLVAFHGDQPVGRGLECALVDLAAFAVLFHEARVALEVELGFELLGRLLDVDLALGRNRAARSVARHRRLLSWEERLRLVGCDNQAGRPGAGDFRVDSVRVANARRVDRTIDRLRGGDQERDRRAGIVRAVVERERRSIGAG